MSLYPLLQETTAEVWTRIPEGFRILDRVSNWTRGNHTGQTLHSFLEGPCFDSAGNLWVVDIPYGRSSASRPRQSGPWWPTMTAGRTV